MQLQFHPVWNATLTRDEKEQYEQFFHITIQRRQREMIVPFLIKEKRLGGIVATVFIQNTTATPMQVEKVTVTLKTAEGKLVATHPFDLDLHIRPNSSMPWSFVFPPQACSEPLLDSSLTVSISQDI